MYSREQSAVSVLMQFSID